MTHTTTLIGDHKGITSPKVKGDEYCVDAALNITLFANREQAAHTISFANPAGGGTITSDDASSTWASIFYPGDSITVGNSDEGANNANWIIKEVTDTVITVTTALTVSANDTAVTLTARYEYLPASDLGLSTITSLQVTGYEDMGTELRVVVLLDGTRAGGNGSGYVLLYGQTMHNASMVANDTDLGYVHVRAHGAK